MMRNDDLGAIILKNFPHNPTFEQKEVAMNWGSFLLSRNSDTAFLLKGYAGTGKTSLVSALVRTMQELKQNVVLMAPTGRAAKVLSSYAGMPAYTIHRRIYRQKSMDTDCFQLNVNLHKHTLFIVDEASMIANEGLTGDTFGSGRLLDDLIHYIYGGDGCRLLLVGDTAQLPPVGEEMSPAMMKEALEGYGLTVCEAELTEVVRQVEESGILWNATHLRQLIQNEDIYAFPQLRVADFPDIQVVPGNELIEALEQCYYEAGIDETIVVTRSNKRANIFNMGIRARILDYEEELCSSDRIIIAKNNYFWIKPQPPQPPRGSKMGEGLQLPTSQAFDNGQNAADKTEGAASKQASYSPSGAGGAVAGSDSFIANGDMATIRRLRNHRELYGFHFADASITLLDHDDQEVDVTLLLDALQSEAPALTRQQQDALFTAVWEDYPELTNKRDRMKRLKEDPYFNALQVKYAYAVTCHKAQGGQWQRVFIDQGYVTEDMLSPDYFRWLYTAITRAIDKVYLINWPKEQTK